MEGAAADLAAAGVHGFPAVLTSFVGRAEAVREVAGLLEEHRLVTVTGPGGVGKTRLAAEAARLVAGRFADGAWLVELAAVADPALVPPVLAAALGVQQSRSRSVLEAVEAALATRQVLLVLDNCEHLLSTMAGLCGALLTAADDVKILATSREQLGVAGETRYRLAPLSLPEQGEAAGVSGAAVELFAHRARQADPHFSLDNDTGPIAAKLVARLDGMPLAIELAAARVEVFGLGPLMDRLGDEFGELTGTDRLAAPRHRTLTATVEWSYRLLNKHEQRIFRRLAVFPGPFTLEAAEAVAGNGAGAAVLHLVDCSLVVLPRAGPDGRFRYSMLQTLRAYGQVLLDQAGEWEEAAAAQAEYALVVAEQAAAALPTAKGELAATQWLDAEDAMMRQVLSWAMDHDTTAALRLTVALAPWWALRGRLPGQYLQLRRASGLAVLGSDLWCAAEFWIGMTARFSADMAGALSHFTAVLDAGHGLGRPRVLTDALNSRASVLREMGRIAEAVEDARDALALARESDYRAGEVRALVNLAQTAMIVDDVGRAVRVAREAGQVTADLPGWADRARCETLTSILTTVGDLAAAEAVCAAGMARCRAANSLQDLAQLLNRMADLDVEAGRIPHAAAHLGEAVQILVRAGGWYELINSMHCCGHLCAATGRYAQAVTMWAAYTAFCREFQTADWPADMRLRQRYESKARQALGAARIREAEERGAAMTIATAAQYVVLLTAPDAQSTAAPLTPGRLTARERELVALVAQGKTDAQIAELLYISIRTVRSHLDRIRDKTGCRRRADLTRLALSDGLV